MVEVREKMDGSPSEDTAATDAEGGATGWANCDLCMGLTAPTGAEGATNGSAAAVSLANGMWRVPLRAGAGDPLTEASSFPEDGCALGFVLVRVVDKTQLGLAKQVAFLVPSSFPKFPIYYSIYCRMEPNLICILYSRLHYTLSLSVECARRTRRSLS